MVQNRKAGETTSAWNGFFFFANFFRVDRPDELVSKVDGFHRAASTGQLCQVRARTCDAGCYVQAFAS